MNHEYTPEFLARFWAKVDCTGGLFACWLWTASTVGGYGSIGWKRHVLVASRVSYEIAFGPFPDDLFVLHKCDNPPCQNPAHLFLGTKQDNVDDKFRKGRQADQHGEKNSNCKLTDADVAEIRRLRLVCGVPRIELARSFGVSQQQIYRIVYHQQRR